MSANRTVPAAPVMAALVAAILTTTAVIATAAHWSAVAAPLRGITAAAWTVFAVVACTSRVRDEMRHLAATLTATIEDYGMERHHDGITEGLRRAAGTERPVSIRPR